MSFTTKETKYGSFLLVEDGSRPYLYCQQDYVIDGDERDINAHDRHPRCSFTDVFVTAEALNALDTARRKWEAERAEKAKA